ncbi:hypothetical protein KQJ29_36950, partial [Enterococcus sp. S181_ASV_20]|nr:hypothetical protein [Enterococcus sp. S181_ASV_20]
PVLFPQYKKALAVVVFSPLTLLSSLFVSNVVYHSSNYASLLLNYGDKFLKELIWTFEDISFYYSAKTGS